MASNNEHCYGFATSGIGLCNCRGVMQKYSDNVLISGRRAEVVG